MDSGAIFGPFSVIAVEAVIEPNAAIAQTAGGKPVTKLAMQLAAPVNDIDAPRNPAARTTPMDDTAKIMPDCRKLQHIAEILRIHAALLQFWLGGPQQTIACRLLCFSATMLPEFAFNQAARFPVRCVENSLASIRPRTAMKDP